MSKRERERGEIRARDTERNRVGPDQEETTGGVLGGGYLAK